MTHYHVKGMHIDEHGTETVIDTNFPCIRYRQRALDVAYSWVKLQEDIYRSAMGDDDLDFPSFAYVDENGYQATVDDGSGVKALIEETNSPFASEEPVGFMEAIAEKLGAQVMPFNDGYLMQLDAEKGLALEAAGFGEILGFIDKDAKMN